MENYAGIDVSLELSSVCVVDAQGKILKEAKVASEPDAFVEFFEMLRLCSEADRTGGWAAIAMAACRLERCRIQNGSAGNSAREGCIVCNDRED